MASFGSGSIRDAIITLDGSAALPAGDGIDISRGYDVVLDVNRSGRLDSGDFIDGLSDEPGFSTVTDLTASGPLRPMMLDTSISAGPVRLMWPAELATLGPRPLVTIVHGGGHDYRWYDYLQEHLASWGYISMSVRNDFSGEGTAPIRHTDALLAQQATVAGGALNGLIDASRIAWFGHSLGGREVVIGVEALVSGASTPANFSVDDLVLVSAIAANAIDGTVRADPHDVNFHMIWGAGDGDISGGLFDQFWPFRHYDLARGFKHSTYIHGADHNDFNCCGFNNFRGPAGTEIGRDQSQRIGKAIWLALLKQYADGDPAAIDYTTRPWEAFRPLSVKPETTIVHMYRADRAKTGSFVIDDYQTQPSLTISSSAAPVSYDVAGLLENELRDGDSTYTWTPIDPMNGMSYAIPGDTSRGAVLEWPAGETRFIEFAVPDQARDVMQWEFLSLRACQQTRHPLTVAELDDLTFTVTLRDAAGNRSSISIGAFGGGVEEPYQRTGYGPGAGWQNEFETIRIRLTDFLTDGNPLDLTDIEAVRLEFGPGFGSDGGRLGLDEIELTR